MASSEEACAACLLLLRPVCSWQPAANQAVRPAKGCCHVNQDILSALAACSTRSALPLAALTGLGRAGCSACQRQSAANAQPAATQTASAAACQHKSSSDACAPGAAAPQPAHPGAIGQPIVSALVANAAAPCSAGKPQIAPE